MNIINLTPHTINVQNETGDFVAFPPSGKVARVSAQLTPVNVAEYGEKITELAFGERFLVSSQEFGAVTGLPEPEYGVLYLVSGLVRQAVPHRFDVLSPGELIRNEAGQPIGCDGFTVNSVAF